MDKDNRIFLGGMLTATCIIAGIIVIKSIFCSYIECDREFRKAEHLTIVYKNNDNEIIDKDLLVNIVKQSFPSSNWEHVSNEVGKHKAQFDAWNTRKQP